MYKNSPLGFLVAVIAGLVAMPARTASGALLELEWAEHPGELTHTLAVGDRTDINIRLTLVEGESWGSIDTPIGLWRNHGQPPYAAGFRITGYAPDGFIGPGFSYDRSGMSLPFSVSQGDFRLRTEWNGVAPIVGPASLLLDVLEIEAVSEDITRIAFGEEIVWYGPDLGPNTEITGADGLGWPYSSEYEGAYPEQWYYGVGHPGFRASPKGPWVEFRPLVLDVVPEPGTVLLVALGGLAIRRSIEHRRSILDDSNCVDQSEWGLVAPEKTGGAAVPDEF